MAKEVKARIILKHDEFANWEKANGFFPEPGEPFLVDDWVIPFMIGDGEHSAAELVKNPQFKVISNE